MSAPVPAPPILAKCLVGSDTGHPREAVPSATICLLLPDPRTPQPLPPALDSSLLLAQPGSSVPPVRAGGLVPCHVSLRTEAFPGPTHPLGTDVTQSPASASVGPFTSCAGLEARCPGLIHSVGPGCSLGGAPMVAWKGSEAHRQTGAWLCDPPTRQGLEPGAGGPFWVPRNVRAPLVCGHAWACLAQGLGTWGSLSRRSKPVPTPRSQGLLSRGSGKQASGSLEPATELTGWVVPATWDIWGTGKGPQPPLAPTGTPPHPTAPGSRTFGHDSGRGLFH